jgi:hypothetical protein
MNHSFNRTTVGYGRYITTVGYGRYIHSYSGRYGTPVV